MEDGNDGMVGLRFSVIIPTLNEAEHIHGTIARIRHIEPSTEIIVADGGSSDSTCAQVLRGGAMLISSPRGRGTQFNQGASCSSGDILLFLHADTLLPQTAFADLAEHFRKAENHVSTFRLRFDTPRWLLSAYAFFTRFDSFYTSFGDQCIAVRRSFFEDIGGFPDWPLFEDVHFLRLAREQTRIGVLPSTVVTSARRFKRLGVLRTQLTNARLMVNYRLGADPQDLAEMYYQKKSRPIAVRQLPLSSQLTHLKSEKSAL